MFDVRSIVETLCKDVPQLGAFEPTDVQLSDLVVPSAKAGEKPPRSITISAKNQPPVLSFDPQFPLDHIVAIDSTSVVLGYVPEGLVGAIRASVITKPAVAVFGINSGQAFAAAIGPLIEVPVMSI